MKNFSFLVIILSIVFFSCKKETAKCSYSDSGAIAPQSEKDSIKRYLAVNGITATKDTSGVYYRIVTQGTGTMPNICSNLTVRYTGSYFTGVVFDATPPNTTSNFDLGRVITGWQKALPFLKNGGSIDLYIPPSLGYGYALYNGIPGNSYLKFSIDLVNVQ